VPHPLSPAGPDIYDFALGDTTTIMLPEREVRVVTLRVRPKDFGLPRIVGTLYLDAETADLVRMAFNFTPRSYLDAELEDVSIVLDNALWERRYWLPYRQEIEIRRRATWLDVPVRGIIRARWEIDGYVLNLGSRTAGSRATRSRSYRRPSAIPFPGRSRSAPRSRTSPSRCARTTWSACARRWSRSPAGASSPVSRAAGWACGACPTCCTRTGSRGSRRARGWWCAAGASGGSCAPARATGSRTTAPRAPSARWTGGVGARSR